MQTYNNNNNNNNNSNSNSNSKNNNNNNNNNALQYVQKVCQKFSSATKYSNYLSTIVSSKKL